MAGNKNKGGSGTPVDHVETGRQQRELKEFVDLVGSSMERFGEYVNPQIS